MEVNRIVLPHDDPSREVAAVGRAAFAYRKQTKKSRVPHDGVEEEVAAEDLGRDQLQLLRSNQVGYRLTKKEKLDDFSSSDEEDDDDDEEEEGEEGELLSSPGSGALVDFLSGGSEGKAFDAKALTEDRALMMDMDWDTSTWTLREIEKGCETLITECRGAAMTAAGQKRREFAETMLVRLTHRHRTAVSYVSRVIENIVDHSFPSLASELDENSLNLAPLLARLAPLHRFAGHLVEVQAARRVVGVLSKLPNLAAMLIQCQVRLRVIHNIFAPRRGQTPQLARRRSLRLSDETVRVVATTPASERQANVSLAVSSRLEAEERAERRRKWFILCVEWEALVKKWRKLLPVDDDSFRGKKADPSEEEEDELFSRPRLVERATRSYLEFLDALCSSALPGVAEAARTEVCGHRGRGITGIVTIARQAVPNNSGASSFGKASGLKTEALRVLLVISSVPALARSALYANVQGVCIAHLTDPTQPRDVRGLALDTLCALALSVLTCCKMRKTGAYEPPPMTIPPTTTTTTKTDRQRVKAQQRQRHQLREISRAIFKEHADPRALRLDQHPPSPSHKHHHHHGKGGRRRRDFGASSSFSSAVAGEPQICDADDAEQLLVTAKHVAAVLRFFQGDARGGGETDELLFLGAVRFTQRCAVVSDRALRVVLEAVVADGARPLHLAVTSGLGSTRSTQKVPIATLELLAQLTSLDFGRDRLEGAHLPAMLAPLLASLDASQLPFLRALMASLLLTRQGKAEATLPGSLGDDAVIDFDSRAAFADLDRTRRAQLAVETEDGNKAALEEAAAAATSALTQQELLFREDDGLLLFAPSSKAEAEAKAKAASSSRLAPPPTKPGSSNNNNNNNNNKRQTTRQRREAERRCVAAAAAAGHALALEAERLLLVDRIRETFASVVLARSGLDDAGCALTRVGAGAAVVHYLARPEKESFLYELPREARYVHCVALHRLFTTPAPLPRILLDAGGPGLLRFAAYAIEAAVDEWDEGVVDALDETDGGGGGDDDDAADGSVHFMALEATLTMLSCAAAVPDDAYLTVDQANNNDDDDDNGEPYTFKSVDARLGDARLGLEVAERVQASYHKTRVANGDASRVELFKSWAEDCAAAVPGSLEADPAMRQAALLESTSSPRARVEAHLLGCGLLTNVVRILRRGPKQRVCALDPRKALEANVVAAACALIAAAAPRPATDRLSALAVEPPVSAAASEAAAEVTLRRLRRTAAEALLLNVATDAPLHARAAACSAIARLAATHHGSHELAAMGAIRALATMAPTRPVTQRAVDAVLASATDTSDAAMVGEAFSATQRARRIETCKLLKLPVAWFAAAAALALNPHAAKRLLESRVALRCVERFSVTTDRTALDWAIRAEVAKLVGRIALMASETAALGARTADVHDFVLTDRYNFPLIVCTMLRNDHHPHQTAAEVRAARHARYFAAFAVSAVTSSNVAATVPLLVEQDVVATLTELLLNPQTPAPLLRHLLTALRNMCRYPDADFALQLVAPPTAEEASSIDDASSVKGSPTTSSNEEGSSFSSSSSFASSSAVLKRLSTISINLELLKIQRVARVPVTLNELARDMLSVLHTTVKANAGRQPTGGRRRANNFHHPTMDPAAADRATSLAKRVDDHTTNEFDRLNDLLDEEDAQRERAKHQQQRAMRSQQQQQRQHQQHQHQHHHHQQQGTPLLSWWPQPSSDDDASPGRPSSSKTMTNLRSKLSPDQLALLDNPTTTTLDDDGGGGGGAEKKKGEREGTHFAKAPGPAAAIRDDDDNKNKKEKKKDPVEDDDRDAPAVTSSGHHTLSQEAPPTAADDAHPSSKIAFLAETLHSTAASCVELTNHPELVLTRPPPMRSASTSSLPDLATSPAAAPRRRKKKKMKEAPSTTSKRPPRPGVPDPAFFEHTSSREKTNPALQANEATFELPVIDDASGRSRNAVTFDNIHELTIRRRINAARRSRADRLARRAA